MQKRVTAGRDRHQSTTKEADMNDVVIAQPLPKPKRETMSIPEKFDLMKLITEHYSVRGMTDTEFARAATDQLGFEIAPSTIKHYREAFGIEQIKAAPVAELRARIKELEARLAGA
jgi:predicted small metal-binding protein